VVNLDFDFGRSIALASKLAELEALGRIGGGATRGTGKHERVVAGKCGMEDSARRLAPVPSRAPPDDILAPASAPRHVRPHAHMGSQAKSVHPAALR
jgi:hypothetical protein